MTDEVVKELYRSRWRRARETLGLVDPGQDDFATGGLGGHVPHLTVRLLVLPADPEVSRIEFDEPMWDWWKGAHQSPFEGSPTDWGNFLLPTSSARPLFKDQFTPDRARRFYYEFRCGILHQAEIGGDSKVWSVGPLLQDNGSRIIVNRTKFHGLLKGEFQSYLAELRDPVNVTLRGNFRTKVNFISRP